MQKKIKAAIVGYGHVGKGAFEAIQESPDIELVGVVRRKKSVGGEQPFELSRAKIVGDIRELGKLDVALLCGPTRTIRKTASEILKLGINTVDSFDIHTEIPSLREELGKVGRQYNSVAIIGAGWDPGIDSVIRGWFLAMAPKGITYTNYGPGMSMGHTVAVKAIAGVKNAMSVTVPAGMGIHRRMVWVQLEPGATFEDVEQKIKADPYFIKDRTYVYLVDDIENLIDMGHGVMMERSGVSGATCNQMLKFEIRVNNPALTAQVMVSAARATTRQKPGCYTMIEIPVVDFLSEDVDSYVKKLV
jgi:diaminopimelate dehydrogenase